MTMIRVSDLSLTYPGAQTPAVDGICFEVGQGEIFGFLGPSGAGKSTTQRVLCRLLQYWSGSVTVMDRSLADWGQDYFAHVGVSFELPNHYLQLTARENLKLFANLYPQDVIRAEDLLAVVDLTADADTRVGQFSKGMMQRLSFVRALQHEPRLVFLDEPTAGLDPVNTRRITDHLQALRADGCTIFLTTHDMHVADLLCDRVAFMVQGRLALIDTPRNLRLAHGRKQVQVEYRTGEGRRQELFDLDGIGGNERFAELLRSEEIETIHTQEATLEDIFIRTTGEQLL
jgi:fluoroquinolone transport system ATP-binding protein